MASHTLNNFVPYLFLLVLFNVAVTSAYTDHAATQQEATAEEEYESVPSETEDNI